MTRRTRLAIVGILTALTLSARTAQAAPPIALNSDSVAWRTHARVRAHVLSTPNTLLVQQRKPDNYDVTLDGRWAIIMPTRSMDAGGGCLASDFYGGRIITSKDGGLVMRPSGEPNCSIRPEHLYLSAIDRLALDPRYIVVDEVASDTMKPITDFVVYLDRKANAGDRTAQAIRSKLAFYVMAGDAIRPQHFPAALRSFFKRTKAPIWGEIYGPEIHKARPRANGVQNGRLVRAHFKGRAILTMRRMGWNVRPMVAAAPRYVGTGRASIINLRQRIRFIRASTGMLPAVWKLNGVTPSEAGLGHMVTYELTAKPVLPGPDRPRRR